MEIGFWLKGLLIGFSIAAPVGPIGILCIRRSLSGGLMAGISTGLGAATADAIYGFIAVFGIATVSPYLSQYQQVFQCIGGIFLVYLACDIGRKPVSAATEKNTQMAGNYLSTFFLTLINPLTIFSFAAVFAGLGAGVGENSYASSLSLVSGVFAGSTLWWVFLAAIISQAGHFLDRGQLQWINYIAAAILFFFGANVLFGLV